MRKVVHWLLLVLLVPAFASAQSKVPRERLAAIDDAQVRAEVEKLYSTDPFQRARGAERLGRLGPRANAATAWLIEALADDACEGDWDPSESVSWYARWALIAIGDAAHDALIETLERPEPLVRERAADLLGETKVRRAVEPLLAVIGRAGVKQAWGTADALGKMKVKAAVAPLIKLLEWDDSKTRTQAAWALASIGDARAIEPLGKLAERDGGNSVAESAAGALAKIPNGGMEAAIALLGHKSPRTRESAARCLAYVRDPRLIDPLLEAIRDPAIQDTAAQSLHWIVKLRGVGVALEAFAMKGAHQEVRRVALVEISRSNHPKKVALLVEGLEDRGEEVQWWAVNALAEAKPPEAVEPLIVVLRTAKNNGVRADAAKALGEIGDRRAYDALIEALDDKTSLARAAAAKALGKLGDPRAIPSLLKLLEDEGFDSRRYAAHALARFEDPRVAPALIGLLEHPSKTTRSDAAWALGKVKAPGVVEALVTALRNEDRYVRDASISSLARLGDPRTAELVRAKLDSPSARRVLDSIRTKRETREDD